MIRAAIFDIDGTLADCSHRRHFVENVPKDWKSFYGAMTKDSLHMNAVDLLRHQATQRDVILVTGRPEEYRALTMAWLDLYSIPWRALFMRKTGDFRQDAEMKLELYKEHIAPRYHVELVVDDRSSVVKMWRSLGLETWQVAEGEF